MTQATDDSIVLSGCGWVTPFISGPIADVLQAVTSGSKPPNIDGAYWAVSEDQVESYPNFSKEIRSDKGAWMPAIAVEHSLRAAALDLSGCNMARVGLTLGCGLAGQTGMIEFANEVRAQSPRFVSPIHFPQTVGNYVAAALARGFQLRGPNITMAGGLASGLEAIHEAKRLIAAGRADFVLAGGTERMSEALSLGMRESNVTLSEGACMFVVERLSTAKQRGATPLATLIESNDSPTEENDTVICSTAGVLQAGAIHIEAIIGRCIGAAGSSAIAAAIGADMGFAVPVANNNGGMDVAKLSDNGKSVATATVQASLPGEPTSSLMLQFVH